MTDSIETSTLKSRWRKVSNLPCLKPKGNRVFATTADQRFLCGTEEFLRTHFPIKLQYRRTSTNQLSELSEQELLAQLLEAEEPNLGNRIFVLYGAAGSGKSELMRWLQTQITLQDSSRSEVTIRISRTELDIFQITQRFQQFQTSQPLQPFSIQRWEECRQKPRTLAKILVLTALEQLLDSDEQINAIYYQLIDIVQNNLEGCFTKIKQAQELQPLEDFGHFIELFSREDLSGLLRDSVVPVPIEYETLRYHLLKVFREQLLEGLHIPTILHQIAERIYNQRQQRPILLIDDLVQSINIFATDLLDYFVTLEEGCWDVIIGITPGSLEATERGKELLSRLNFLDTIDDRVEKLWLSDEHGFSSSFLNETNCVEYANAYLNEYKNQNKRPCNSTCPAFAQCRNLSLTEEANLLTPFNRELLVRLFRSLPADKGKVRYFNLYLGDILRRTAAGENLLEVLAEYVKPEQAVYQLETNLAQAYEFYGPLVEIVDNVDYNRLNDLRRFFGFKTSSLATQEEIRPIVTSLLQVHSVSESSVAILPENTPSISLDPGKQAVKAWLAGSPVNKQLLRNLRRGVVKAVKDLYPLDVLTRLNTANTNRVLRWGQSRQETVPPVSLENIDDFEGLEITRHLGPLVYTLYDYADTNGVSETRMRENLLNNVSFSTLLFQATLYRQKISERLETQLGIKLDELAFCLVVLAGGLGSLNFELPPRIAQKVQVLMPTLDGADAKTPINLKYPVSLSAYWPGFNAVQLVLIRRFFDDCFKLRENVYDGFLLEEMLNRFEVTNAIEFLLSVVPARIEPDFRFNDEQFGAMLVSLLQPLSLLQVLKTDDQTRTTLIAACEGSYTLIKNGGSKNLDGPCTQLLEIICPVSKSIKKTEDYVSGFLARCDLLTLHKTLVLAQLVEQAYHEEFLAQFQTMFLDFGLDNTETINFNRKNVKKGGSIFTEAELALLAKFAQHNFRLPLPQISPNFLAKIAQHFPSLYHELELRISYE